MDHCNLTLNYDRAFQLELLLDDLLALDTLDPSLTARALELRNYILDTENQ